MWPLPGTVRSVMSGDLHTGAEDYVGPYRLAERIGEGGMGVVYHAFDPQGRDVAVKVLRPQVAEESDARARLAREVETMRRVMSPHVAQVLDADVTGERPYIVTRYIPGQSLEQVVSDGGPLSQAAAMELARGLASALAAIHAAGVVHRDLKPANILLLNGAPVVIDFGIAQAVGSSKLTQTGMFIGTPGFLAPEVVEGGRAVAASDVHSWAAALAFASTGRAPFGTGNFESIFFNIVRGRFDIEGIPEPLRSLLEGAFARDPAQRPQAGWLYERMNTLTGSTHGGTQALGAAAEAATMVSGTPAQGAPDGAAATRVGEQAGPLSPSQVDLPPAPPPQYDHTGAYGPAESRWHERRPEPERRHHPVVDGLLLAATCVLGLVAPFFMMITVLVALVVLRVANDVDRRMVDRRSRQGSQSVDAMVVSAGLPWYVLRATLVTLLALPLALLAAVVVGALVGFWLGPQLPWGSIEQNTFGLASAVFVAMSLLGPGGGGPRRAVGRALTYALPGRTAPVVAGAVLGCVMLLLLTMFTAGGVLSWWPFDGPPQGPDFGQFFDGIAEWFTSLWYSFAESWFS